MRVGIFTEVYKPYVSGVVTSILMLKKSLEDLGHEVYVVTINMDKVKYEYDEKERVLRVPGINSGIYDNFKVSYGCEAYLVGDFDDTVVNEEGQTLQDSFLVFDLETTGFAPTRNRIIEIGAVKVEKGKITDRFSTCPLYTSDAGDEEDGGGPGCCRL